MEAEVSKRTGAVFPEVVQNCVCSNTPPGVLTQQLSTVDGSVEQLTGSSDAEQACPSAFNVNSGIAVTRARVEERAREKSMTRNWEQRKKEEGI